MSDIENPDFEMDSAGPLESWRTSNHRSDGEIVVLIAVLGLTHMQLCGPADATDEALLDVANRMNPSGTQNGWTSIERSGRNAPVTCAEDSARRHFLAVC